MLALRVAQRANLCAQNPIAGRWSFATWFYDFLSTGCHVPPIFLPLSFLSSFYTFSHFKHSLLRQSPNPPTFYLLFTPLNSYSVCSIILRTLRTFRSLVSYSWNNVLTAGYTVCIFTALMYVQFAFICKYRAPSAIQSNSRCGAITIIKLVYLSLTIKSGERPTYIYIYIYTHTYMFQLTISTCEAVNFPLLPQMSPLVSRNEHSSRINDLSDNRSINEWCQQPRFLEYSFDSPSFR